jgi:hypothetical protein
MSGVLFNSAAMHLAAAQAGAQAVPALLRPGFAQPQDTRIFSNHETHASAYEQMSRLQDFVLSNKRFYNLRMRRSSDGFRSPRAKLARRSAGAGVAGAEGDPDEAQSDIESALNSLDMASEDPDLDTLADSVPEPLPAKAPAPGCEAVHALLDALARHIESASRTGASESYLHGVLEEASGRFVVLASQGLLAGQITLLALQAYLHWLRWLWRRYLRGRRSALADVSQQLFEALGEQTTAPPASERLHSWHLLLPLWWMWVQGGHDAHEGVS